ncbi:Mpo1-like protein [Bacillus toyonensis]|uniref:Permease n=1 Tax=Bacillus toyonensis TaxID=155322 RepID=A0A2C4QBV1_9BACI|nr:Mpo1-like protein [Bacillus toyonensis]PGA89729.1 permease [Bacillus toyonensis]PHD61981.1 permease [Bacillus toyonensis]
MDFQKMLKKYRDDHQHPMNKFFHFIGIPTIIISIFILFVNWKLGVSLFILGWIFQFVGHAIEGKKPTFLSNPAYLVVGPIYFLKKVLKRN